MFFDGLHQLAQNLAMQVKPKRSCGPSNRLLTLFKLGLEAEKNSKHEMNVRVALSGGGKYAATDQTEANDLVEPALQQAVDNSSAPPSIPPSASLSVGLDLDFQADASSDAPLLEPAHYQTVYITKHQSPVRALAFHPSALYFASGADDSYIKVVDTERVAPHPLTFLEGASRPADSYAKAASALEQMADSSSSSTFSDSDEHERSTLARTLFDHTGMVTALEFHPSASQQLLASGGGPNDCSIRFYDLSNSNAKHAMRAISEVLPINSLAFHPSGDYLLVACDHPTLRLYDVASGACFVSHVAARDSGEAHTAPVLMARWASDGSLFASCSLDGSVRLWDGLSGRLVRSFPQAHEGAPVLSIQFTRNTKYLLSSGKDAVVRLWDLRAASCLISYTGAGAMSTSMDIRCGALFNHTEDFVLQPDERSGSLCSWDSRNADRQALLALGHGSGQAIVPVRAIAHSTVAAVMITGADDGRCRLWMPAPASATGPSASATAT